MTTLIINPSESLCGNCGKSAHPEEKAHISRLGYQPGGGCQAVFTEVGTHYSNQDFRAMRPDLPWIGLTKIVV